MEGGNPYLLETIYLVAKCINALVPVEEEMLHTVINPEEKEEVPPIEPLFVDCHLAEATSCTGADK